MTRLSPSFAANAARRLSIRLKVALAFSAAMAAVLACIGVLLFFRTKNTLDHAISAGLQSRSIDLAALLQARSRGTGNAQFDALPDPLFRLVTPNGHLLASSPAGNSSLLSPNDLRRAESHRILIEHQERLRLLAEPLRLRDQNYVLVVGASLEEREQTLETLTGFLLIGGAIALLVAGFTGYGLAAFPLRAVDRMRARANEVSLNDSSLRLPLPPANDEVRRLATTLNAMLDRLHAAIAHERTFIADASHELRTPLARMRTELDIALVHARTPDELRAALDSLSDETDQLTRLANDMLVLTRLDDDPTAIHLRDVGANEILNKVAASFRNSGDAASPLVTYPPDLRLRVDANRLEQAVANMLDNAIRYGRPPIEVEALTQDGSVEIHVRDAGAGINPAFLDRAFERFSRGDQAHTQAGAGLGLAIVRAIARAHGGDAHLSTRAGGGLDAWIVLPRCTTE